MKTHLLPLFAVVLACAQSQAPIVPLEGLDPVALTQGQELDGSKQFTVTRGRFQYQFANAVNKAAFEKDPARYEIQLEGTCARMGPQAGGNPDFYAVSEGRIYVFGSEECRKRFVAAPAKYLESRQPGPPPLPVSSAAVAKARALLARAVDAMGGAAAIDGLASYEEARDGNEEKRTFIFPDRLRIERTFGGRAHVTWDLDGNSGVIEANDTTRDLAHLAVLDLLRDARRGPLMILRARNQPGFRAAALDENTVEIEFDGDRDTLTLDPATGQIAGVKFTGRGPGGEFGTVARRYSEFSKQGGLILPTQVSTFFNHDAEPFQTAKILSITLKP